MKYVISLLLIPLICACTGVHTTNPSPQKAFYFWKSQFALSGSELSTLQDLNVKKLYIKLFDIVAEAGTGAPMPVAKILINRSTLEALAKDQVKLVPTVFITNETFTKIDSAGACSLASKVAALLDAIIKNNQLATHLTNEIQFDCDWTAVTKHRYFAFLSTFRNLANHKTTLISATIRLYQCKYLLKTGVPPVNRGLLMCYNMGNLRDPANTGNSILNLVEMEKYTSSLKNYPLDLDIALPLFDWTVLIRNNAFAGLLTQLPASLFQNNDLVSRNGSVYTLLKDTVIVGYSLKQHDKLRVENSEFAEIIRAGHLLAPRLKNKDFTLSLYHLDSNILNKYTTDELENIYNSIH